VLSSKFKVVVHLVAGHTTTAAVQCIIVGTSVVARVLLPGGLAARVNVSQLMLLGVGEASERTVIPFVPGSLAVRLGISYHRLARAASSSIAHVVFDTLVIRLSAW
jgi:hypothetical protein